MMFTVKKDQLLSAVLLIERVVGKKESLPILSCILLKTNKKLILSATNLESAIEVVVNSTINDSGVIAVPATILSQTLRSLTSDSVIVRIKDSNLLLETYNSKTLIKAIPYSDFPVIPRGEGEGVIIERMVFVRGVTLVLYAASMSMIRPELGSLYVSIKNRSITFAATDSFRLAEKVITGSLVKGKETELLIPLKHASELVHILDRVEDEVITLVPEDAHITIKTSQTEFVSRLVDGVFPNYTDIIPKKFETEATLLKADFAEAVQKARVFAGAEQQIGVHVYPKKKIMTVTAQNGDIGEMSDNLEAALRGGDLDINFHIDYLADCLQSIEGDSINLAFAGAGKPLVVTSAGDEGFTYLVMPLNR